MSDKAAAELVFPFQAVPEAGQAVTVAPGVLWLRFRMPFRLDHVNIFAIEDGPGWAVVDTGLGNEETRAAWEAALAGPLGGRPVTRVIATHAHPDHVGCAGWLAGRFGIKYVFFISVAGFTLASALCRFPAKEDATIFATTVGHAFNDTSNNFGKKFSGGDVVKKEEWSRSLDQDVIHAMIDEVASDGVVNASEESNLEFCPDSVRRSHQNRMLQIREGAIKHPTETAYFGERAVVKGPAR